MGMMNQSTLMVLCNSTQKEVLAKSRSLANAVQTNHRLVPIPSGPEADLVIVTIRCGTAATDNWPLPESAFAGERTLPEHPKGLSNWLLTFFCFQLHVENSLAPLHLLGGYEAPVGHWEGFLAILNGHKLVLIVEKPLCCRVTDIEGLLLSHLLIALTQLLE